MYSRSFHYAFDPRFHVEFVKRFKVTLVELQFLILRNDSHERVR